MAFKFLDKILPTDITMEIRKHLHKSLMNDITKELPAGHAMICPFATAFEKYPENPIDYLLEKHGAQVFEHGYHYNDAINFFLPYTWSSVIIRIPGNNKILVFYSSSHRHVASLLFTAYFEDGEIITERFYYKNGKEEALLSGSMLLNQLEDIPDRTVLNYLAHVSGYHPEIFLQIQDTALTWSNPEKIMDTLKKQAEPYIVNIDSTYKDMYGDQTYFTLENRYLFEHQEQDDYPFNTQDRYENR